VAPDARQPYAGRFAFTHKAGLHASGVERVSRAYEHVEPTAVGNRRGVVASDLGGAATIRMKADEFGLDLGAEAVPRLLADLKDREARGYTFEVADASLELLMRRAGLQGLPNKRRHRSKVQMATATDLVERAFARSEPDQLWVTDITEHRTREGKLYCSVVLDVFSRRVVGWSIDSAPTAALVTNALGMAIQNRDPDGTLIHSDHGTQFTSWAFTRRALDSGLVPSMGSIGDCFDNAVIESFWARMQVELLDRQRWSTRVELANAIFEYLEMFHNRKRRHSALGCSLP